MSSFSGSAAGASRNRDVASAGRLVAERVERGVVPVAGHQPARPRRPVVEADPPVHGVGAEERQVGAGVPCGLDGAAHAGRPVLVVARRDVAECSGQQVVVVVEVDVGEVGQRLAGHLGPDHDRDDRDVEVVHATDAVVGPVEADRPAAPVAARAVVQAVAAPEVVGLPGRHRDHHGDRAGGRGRGDDVGDLVLPARGGPQPEHVEARLPAGRVDGQAHVPRRHDGPGLGRLEHRVGLPLARGPAGTGARGDRSRRRSRRSGRRSSGTPVPTSTP